MRGRTLDGVMNARTYDIRTYGCQMNVHDSERIAGLLEDAGYVRADPNDVDGVDLVVFNTCAVRENADNRLYGNLGQLYPAKQPPRMQIAVGGCLAQKDRGRIVEKAPWVDVVFGTHNLASLPVLLERARHNADAQVEIVEALQNFPSDLPTRRESPYSAWVSISVGCDNTCTFCIVPRLRGIETDRPPDDVLREIRALVQSGVVEITLLGQNVNSYGRSFGDRFAFGKLLRACGEIDGLDRVRFTSPHPRDFTDDVIDAMAQTPNVCPQLHMPMQSGSDVILKAMRRSYRQARYLDIIARVRSAMPDAAITTDIIVGFPGETEQDFEQTLHVVREARFAGAFTFQYSKRPGTAGGGDGRPGTQGRRAGAVRPADRRARGHFLGREPGTRRPRGRGTGQRRRRTQGRCHRPGLRSSPGWTAGARLHARRTDRAGGSGDRDDHPRGATSPARRRRHHAYRRWRGERTPPAALVVQTPRVPLGLPTPRVPLGLPAPG